VLYTAMFIHHHGETAKHPVGREGRRTRRKMYSRNSDMIIDINYRRCGKGEEEKAEEEREQETGRGKG